MAATQAKRAAQLRKVHHTDVMHTRHYHQRMTGFRTRKACTRRGSQPSLAAPSQSRSPAADSWSPARALQSPTENDSPPSCSYPEVHNSSKGKDGSDNHHNNSSSSSSSSNNKVNDSRRNSATAWEYKQVDLANAGA